MHELSIAQNILDIVQQYVPEGDRRAVRSVRTKIGELSGVVADSLEFCFEAITTGTPLEGARLDITWILLRVHCKACGTSDRIEQTLFRCPSCGSDDLEIVEGRELQVTEIELDDGDGKT